MSACLTRRPGIALCCLLYGDSPFNPAAVIDDKEYDVELTLEDIIEGQMKKVIPIMEANEALPQDGDTML